MKKNLVMGTAGGFDWDTLEPFVTSFVMNVKSAELVLFLKDISDFTLDRLKRCGKGALKIEPFEYREIKNIGIDRFKNFKRYVDLHGDDYEQIFITDTRDVIFQKDIFESFKDCKNFLGYSTEADDIRGSKTGNRLNYNWIADSFGKEEADNLLDKKIVCAGGAVIGTPREVKIFLEIFLSKNFSSEKFAFDQAAFNYLVWNNLLPIENLIENDIESGEIFSMATFVFLYPINIRGGKILRGDGGIPAVVHQYDRHQELVKIVDGIYRAKDFQVDERFIDERSAIEQTLPLLRANKTDAATRLFIKNFLGKTDFSGYGRILIKLWDISSRKPLSQTLELLEMAVQDALKSVHVLSNTDLLAIYSILKRAEQNGRTVDADFKIYFANFLLIMAEQCLKSKLANVYFEFINLFKGLGVPPDEKFYRLEAEANKIFGRNGRGIGGL